MELLVGIGLILLVLFAEIGNMGFVGCPIAASSPMPTPQRAKRFPLPKP